MKLDLSLENGYVVSEKGVYRAHIGIKNEIITCLMDAVDDPYPAETRIDINGLYVFPGMIDPHGHFWEPGPSEREGWETGTKAAAAGGVTTVIEMPLSIPPTINRETFLQKKNIAEQKSLIDFALWGGVIPESSENLTQNLSELRELGAVAYKTFMCWAATEFPPIDDGLLYETMMQLARTNELIAVHAENDSIIKRSETILIAKERFDPMAHVESRPFNAELEAINRALFLSHLTGVRLHIVHMSLSKGAEIIKKAKQYNKKISVETAPQYLVLSEEELKNQGPYAKCAPPLRSRQNLENLWKFILDGTIDFIGSDHAPFTQEEKNKGEKNIWLAPNGLPGIQEMFPLIISEGVHKRRLSLERVASICAGNTARIFGIYPQKGTIMPGSDADVVIVDLNKKWRINPDRLFYKNKWTPYNGMDVQGQIEMTIVRGSTIFKDGEIVAQPGYGKFVRPSLSDNYECT